MWQQSGSRGRNTKRLLIDLSPFSQLVLAMMSRKTTIILVQVRSRTVVLERAREGLGRDLDNLSEEARLLQEAREELARCLTYHLVDNCNLNQND